jgi:hypothetical protein
MSQRKDLTIDEAIRDPMIRLVMKADHIDPRAFEAMLRSMAAAQDAGGEASRFPKGSGSQHSRPRSSGEVCVSW